MAKRLTIPGSIFVPANSKNLYITYKSKRISTGLKDTPQNRKIAEETLKQIHLEHLGLVERKTPHSASGTVKEIYDAFLSRYAIQKSAGTHEVYNISFKRIFEGREEKPFLPSFADECVLRYIKTTKHGSFTVHHTLRTINTFFAWSVREGLLSSNPIKREYFPKTPKPSVDIFSDEEIKLLLEYFDASDPEYGRLVSFLLLTGFRIHEALKLRWADIRADRIYVESKDGRETEYVPMTPQLHSILQSQKEATQLRPSTKDLSAYVFRWQEKSSARLRSRLYAAMDALGIEKRGRSLHEFRKTFISKMANEGIDIRLAASLARCSIEVMTEHYTVLNSQVVANAAERIGSLFPLVLVKEAGSRNNSAPI